MQIDTKYSLGERVWYDHEFYTVKRIDIDVAPNGELPPRIKTEYYCYPEKATHVVRCIAEAKLTPAAEAPRVDTVDVKVRPIRVVDTEASARALMKSEVIQPR